MISKMMVSLLTMSLTIAAYASSNRFVVVMKDQASFAATQQSLQMQPMAVNATRLKLSLPHIRAMVLESGDMAAINRLRANPNVAIVEAEIFHPAPKPVVSSATGAAVLPRDLGPIPHSVDVKNFQPTATTPWGIGAVKAVAAWGNSSAGASARVLILDTGIDKDHPSLAANFEKGQSFVDDSKAAAPGDKESYDYFDKVGHGTHVAGTIAGVSDDLGFTGVAPMAHVLSGRVCSEEGCSNVAIVRGLEWAITEHVDVVSMSLGGSSSTIAERVAMANTYNAGITIVVASGNESAAAISYPAALPQAIAVGAVDSKSVRATFSNYGDGLAIVAPGVAVLSSVPQGTGRVSDVKITLDAAAPLAVESSQMQGSADTLTAFDGDTVFANLGKPEDFTGLDIKGKIALISRGDITFADKVNNAIAAGASGVIVFNNVAGMMNGTLGEGVKVDVPVFMIGQDNGTQMRDTLAAKKNVHARLLVQATNYAQMDGTSMATPHVSGVVALMKAVNHALSPAQVKDILQKTAHALAPNDQNQYGAGLVDAQAAVQLALTTVGLNQQPVPVQPAP